MSWSGSTASTSGACRGTEGAIWQLTAIDIASSYAWAELVICKQGNPTARQTSKLARRVARELKAAGWQLERMLSDNGNEFSGRTSPSTLDALKARHTRIHAGRPQTNGNVEALHKTILDECWRPAFARYLYPRYTGLKRELDTYLRFYNTRPRPPRHDSPKDASPQTSSTVPERWRPDEPHLSAHPGGCPAQALRDWCRFNTTGTLYIEPGSPWENPFIESFNSRMRDEHWNTEEFTTLTEAQILTETWRIEYNTIRPHSALGGLTPNAYAAVWTTTTTNKQDQPTPTLS